MSSPFVQALNPDPDPKTPLPSPVMHPPTSMVQPAGAQRAQPYDDRSANQALMDDPRRDGPDLPLSQLFLNAPPTPPSHKSVLESAVDNSALDAQPDASSAGQGGELRPVLLLQAPFHSHVSLETEVKMLKEEVN